MGYVTLVLVAVVAAFLAGVKLSGRVLAWLARSRWTRWLGGLFALLVLAVPLHGQAVDTIGWTRDSVQQSYVSGWVKDSTPVWRYDSTATLATRWVYDSVPVTQPHPVPVPSAGHPNEPAGFVRVASHDANTLPVQGGSPWWFAAGRLAVVNDPVRGQVWQTFYPQGFQAGKASVNVGVQNFPEQRALYWSGWLKLAGANWENQASVTKILGFWEHADLKLSAATTVGIPNQGAPQPASAFVMDIREQQPVVRNIEPNVDKRPLLTVGAWHHVEVLMDLDGTAKLWIDGTLTVSVSNAVWRTAAQPHGFFGWKWNPTWGGGNIVINGKSQLQIKSRYDAALLDDIYMSGVPCGAGGC